MGFSPDTVPSQTVLYPHPTAACLPPPRVVLFCGCFCCGKTKVNPPLKQFLPKKMKNVCHILLSTVQIQSRTSCYRSNATK